jgi:beta-phosphoglucomutase
MLLAEEVYMAIEAVIFDLDGVIVSTDEFHYRSWQRLADEERIYFDRGINHRLRGVSRMESLEILLDRSPRQYTPQQKIELAARKNGYYVEFLKNITPADILPGAMDILRGLRARGVKIAVGSSSKNSPLILARIGLADFFDATADGNDITHSKPDPEVFLVAAKRMGVAPANCLVVEDARAGVEAAIAGGMKCLAVAAAAGDERADLSAKDLTGITVEQILAV